MATQNPSTESTAAKEAAERNRRAAERKSLEAAGELRSCDPYARTQSRPIQIQDVSATGVGIVHDEPLLPGSQYVVKQDSFSANQPRLYTVVRSKCKKDGSFAVGLHASQVDAPAAPKAKKPKSRPKPLSGAILMMIGAVWVLAAAALVCFKTLGH
jgi:PilZ domain-containing protein